MKILITKGWTDGFLDQALTEGKVRIQVACWKNLEELAGLYFIRARSLLILWNYLREIGPRQLIIKILSRSKENLRNEKYVSCGLGFVLESDPHGSFAANQQVLFVAPGHPRCMERVVLPHSLVVPAPDFSSRLAQNGILQYFPAEESAVKWWSPVSGWSEYSGSLLQSDKSDNLLAKVESELLTLRADPVELDILRPTPVQEKRDSAPPAPGKGKKTACLIGYGNYAKTCILPNIKTSLEVRRIHEIDPTQIPLDSAKSRIGFDTSPALREDEHYDIYFIASYHHTHAPLAIHALKQGAWAVVEKPVTTSWEQLWELLDTLKQSEGGLFVGFHKRYSPLNDLARQDLGVKAGDAISYHCIVYEVPLPDLHWYRWPNSCSRLVSNGCHWLDHFLFLNNWSGVRWTSLVEAADGTLNVSVQLENGAFFSMVLTDIGSERIGVQDYVELRANSVTVKITNGAVYSSESTRAAIRTRKINKVSAYGEMYRRIAERIITGGPGDSLQSVDASSSLILSLEEQLMKNRKSHLQEGGLPRRMPARKA